MTHTHEAFLERLRKAAHVFEIRVHADCLMGNHLNLLVETRKPTLSRFGQRLLGGVLAPGALQAIRQAEAGSAIDLPALERSLFN